MNKIEMQKEIEEIQIILAEQGYYNRCEKLDKIKQALTDSKDGWRDKPTEEMCDNTRGFISGVQLACVSWLRMSNHLRRGGYKTLPHIEENAKSDPNGHITKWDIADCIYQLMVQPPKERG